jgi:hypothetical protein
LGLQLEIHHIHKRAVVAQVVDPNKWEADCTEEKVLYHFSTPLIVTALTGDAATVRTKQAGAEGVLCDFQGMMGKAEPVSAKKQWLLSMI